LNENQQINKQTNQLQKEGVCMCIYIKIGGVWNRTMMRSKLQLQAQDRC
jgi:hypothetical protein